MLSGVCGSHCGCHAPTAPFQMAARHILCRNNKSVSIQLLQNMLFVLAGGLVGRNPMPCKRLNKPIFAKAG